MKKIIFYILVALLVVTVGCNDDDNSLPVIKPEKTGTVTIGENTYGWARYAGLDWMTSNFKEGTPYYELTYIDQYGYTNDLINDCEDLTPEEWDRYGNLYSYEEAKANAPEGWRLPTDEDWKKLERAMGMSQGDGIPRDNGRHFAATGCNGDGYCIASRWICHCIRSSGHTALPALERVRIFLDGYGRKK